MMQNSVNLVDFVGLIPDPPIEKQTLEKKFKNISPKTVGELIMFKLIVIGLTATLRKLYLMHHCNSSLNR